MRAWIRINGWTKRRNLAGLIAAVLFWVAPSLGLAQEEGIIAGGKLEFGIYCTTCHGPEAEGDGPMASQLRVQPADLTQISKKNGGKFPTWRIYRMIDGTEPLARGHGSKEMPIWGDEFRVKHGGTSSAEVQVRGLILQLIYYLQSIQEE